MLSNQTTQAMIFPEKGKVELVARAVAPLKASEILVRTTRTLISTGTEGIVLTGNFAPGTHWHDWVKFPFQNVGYLHAGRVVDVGADVEKWKIGDRVATRSPHAGLVVVEAERALAIAPGVSDEDAAWMGLGKITQVGVRAAQHVLGDTVVVIGLGLLGQLVVQYARLSGASEVIAIDTAPRRLEMAASHGATHTLRVPAGEAREAVFDLTGGRGADVVYDITGHPAVFATALPLARRFGTVVLLGDAGNPQLQTLTGDVVTRGLKIVGAHDGHPPDSAQPGVRWSSMEMQSLFLKYVARGQIRVSDLITHRFSPEQAPEAYALLQRERETAMGVIFEWNNE